MEWSNNNAACVTTWSTLRLLEQIPLDTVFKKCGEMKVSDLLFFGAAASPEMIAFQAASLAASLDNIFREVRKALYEERVSRVGARAKVTKALRDGTNTLPGLAEVIDAQYRFLREVKD